MVLHHNPWLQSVLGEGKFLPNFRGSSGQAPGHCCAKTPSSRGAVTGWERERNIPAPFWGFWRIREAWEEVAQAEKDGKEKREGWIRAWRHGEEMIRDPRVNKWRTGTNPCVWECFPYPFPGYAITFQAAAQHSLHRSWSCSCWGCWG